MSRAAPLAGVTVLEHGDRIAVSACGTVLASLGASVTVAASGTARRMKLPPVQLLGKRLLSLEHEPAEVERVAATADVVLTSSDVSAGCALADPEHQIVCDITAYGKTGPMAGQPHSDALVQAYSGLADTTGEPDGPPTLCPFPQTEGMAALYAAAGVLTALRVRTRTGFGQAIEIALFDCAFSTLSTFLPFHFGGQPVTRAGNRHVLASPWNAYRAADGWLLVCTGSDEQWCRLCEVMRRPDLATDPGLGKAQDRVRQRALVDAAVQAWLSALSAAEAARALDARGIAAGEIVAVRDLAEEPNIAHRGVYSRNGLRSAIRHFAPQPDGVRSPSVPFLTRTAADVDAAALADLTVLEIGQYTTAPLVARNLGALGARVLKIEPPAGDATRAWPPQRDGQGYFFTLSNSDKRSLSLDLRTNPDRTRFRTLLRHADVLVENLKPGALDRLGFGPAERAAINPRLVYCAISGFGADSAYPGRPAFDTVIQAMSGIMDLVRVRDVPQKTGISYADVLGGLFALVGTLASIVARERSGSGDAIDVSMQDAAAWISQWQVADPEYGTQAAVVACSDGYVTIEANGAPVDCEALETRAALVARLTQAGLRAAPVLRIDEVATSAHARAREVLRTVSDSAGREWPVFACPIRMSRTPAKARCAIGPLGEANEARTDDDAADGATR